MYAKRLFQLLLVIILASVTSSFTVQPELQTQPVLRELKLATDNNHPFPWPTLHPPYTFYPPFSLPGSVLEPEPQSPTDRCLCVVRCCKTTMRMRRAVTLTRSMPLVRRKRCCGCQDCGSL